EKPIPMQFKQTLARLLFILCPAIAFSQTTYLQLGSKDYIILERIEILAQKDSVLNFSKTKPYSRKQIIPAVEKYVSIGDGSLIHTEVKGITLSNVDLHNISSLYAANPEWAQQQIKSKKPIAKSFYTSPANLYEVHVKDF